jgi:hypothetical protein
VTPFQRGFPHTESHRLEELEAVPPPPWFRVLYFIFGYAVVALGIYLLIILVRYRKYIEWH